MMRNPNPNKTSKTLLMKNTTNATAPAGYSRETLTWALRNLAGWESVGRMTLTLSPEGWSLSPSALADADELELLDYDGILAAAPDEHPEDYTDETFEGLAEWVERNIAEWVREAIDAEIEEVEREDAYRAQVDQRPANPNATSERLEALRAILANLKRA